MIPPTEGDPKYPFPTEERYILRLEVDALNFQRLIAAGRQGEFGIKLDVTLEVIEPYPEGILK